MSDEKNKDLVVQSSNKFIETFKSKANDMLVSYFGDPQKVARFYAAMNMCFAANPKLKECSPTSLSTVFMTCAEVGLYPSNYSGECYVIPYKIKGEMTATFQIGYQGLVTLAYRAKTKKVDAHVIYEKDYFEYKFGLNPMLDHRPDIFGGDRGEPIGAYATATLESDETIFLVMSKDDIFEHRAKSQSYQRDVKYKSKNSPWQPENDPQLWMWKKTVVKQLAKLMPKSPIMQQAIAADVQGDIIDMTSHKKDVMSQELITAYYKRLKESYSDDNINEAILKETSTGTLDKLTIEEASNIEARLKGTVQDEPEGDGSQGSML
jgi:recombination protein RecT